MAVTYVRLLDETGTPLQDDEGVFLLAYGDSAQDLVGGSGAQKGKGGFNNRLWDIFQEEIARNLKPPAPPEPEPEPIQEVMTEPAPKGGFFDAYTDPAEMISRARAAAEARAAQQALNTRTISDLLRKARR